MRIGIDLDGVCYDFVGHLQQHMMERWPSPSIDDLPAVKWNFYEDWGMDSEEFWGIVHVAYIAGDVWYRTDAVVPGAKQALWDLHMAGHQVVIITTRPDYARFETEQWLRHNTLYHDELIFTEDKAKAQWNLDVLLDDAPHNIVAAQDAGIRAVVWSQEWNLEVAATRVNEWWQFVDLVEAWNRYDAHTPPSYDWSDAPAPNYTIGGTPIVIDSNAPANDIAVSFGWEAGDHVHTWDAPTTWGKLFEIPEDAPPRAALLDEAKTLVCGDRNNQYGPPDQDFARTAELWTAWKGVHFDPHEVAVFMNLLKLSRIRWQPEKQDSWADSAGYIACGYETYQARGATTDAGLPVADA